MFAEINLKSMKRVVFFAFALLISHVALAQSDNKSFLSISAGPSLATGNFALKDITSEDAGLAKTGIFADLAYGYKFSKHVGGMALLKGKTHGLDVTDFNLPLATDVTVDIETGRWKSAAAMAGLFIHVPLDNAGALQLSVKGLAGAQYSARPFVQITVTERSEYNYSQGTSRQESVSGYGFSYLFGSDLKYSVNNKLALMLSLDYNSSNIKFEDSVRISGEGIVDVSSKNAISTLDLGLGVAFAF